MTETVASFHDKFLAVLDAHQRIGGPGLPEQHGKPSSHLRADGHMAIRALIEEIHDAGYVLGQLHADGIFPNEDETEVAARERRLGIAERKNQERSRQVGARGGGPVVNLGPDPLTPPVVVVEHTPRRA